MTSNKRYIDTSEDSISNYLKEVRKIDILTPEEESVITKLVSEGDNKALDKLIKSNLRFVISIAKEYQGQGVPLVDLINEGNYGLVKAAQKFDHTRGFRFISYAVWWVKQSILQSLNDNARTIRLPVNVVQDLHRAKKEIDAKGGELDAKFTSLPSMIDLDMQINEEGDNLFDVLKNDDADMPDEAFHTKDILRTKLLGLLTCLDERERAIVEDYFGLSGSPRTLEDIGGDFNLTKERVRQIKEKSLRKLRNLSGDLFEWM